jgi:predicted lipid carrier protein YhbT
MATVDECRAAIDDLARLLAGVDADLRARHVPERTLSCHVSDLGLTFTCRLDADGVHDVAQAEPESAADLRLTMSSDELVSLAEGREDFLSAWLRGRVQVSASMRDLLRLRSLFGL